MKIGLVEPKLWLLFIVRIFITELTVQKGVFASVELSLASWDICDMGYTKASPKVCVMQRNLGDDIKLLPRLRSGDGEHVVEAHWYRIVRIFPGEKLFENVLNSETGGTYVFKGHTLEIPSLSDIDMDKNRLKFAVTGSLGGHDDITISIEQVPIDIRKFRGDAMLIDLSHYMTIPESVAHYNWTFRPKSSSHRHEEALPAGCVTHKQMLKVTSVQQIHEGLYICAFYGGPPDGAMSFFLGQKVFRITIIPHKPRRRHKSQRGKLVKHRPKKHKIKPVNIRRTNHQRNLKNRIRPHRRKIRRNQLADLSIKAPSRTNVRKVPHRNTYVSGNQRKISKSKSKFPNDVRFEKKKGKSDDDDDDDDDEGDDDDDDEDDKGGKKSSSSKDTKKTGDVTTKSAPLVQTTVKPATTKIHPVVQNKALTITLTPSKPTTKVPVKVIDKKPVGAPVKGVVDYAAMPGRTISPNETGYMVNAKSGIETGDKGTKGSAETFDQWLREFHRHTEEEAREFLVHKANTSLMDFKGQYDALSVIYSKSGQPVVLKCPTVTADGTVDKSGVVWKRVKPLAATLTASADRYEVLDSGDLKMLNPVAEDSGEYACEIQGKQSGNNVPLSVFTTPLPRVFITVPYTASTCKAYLIEKLTEKFINQIAPHVCADERCSMATPVMSCHMDNASSSASEKDQPDLTLKFNFKLGVNARKKGTLEEMYSHIAEIYKKARMFVEKNGEIFQPDVFDGRFKPAMTSMRMNTYAYCSPGFGIMIDVASSKEKEFRCLACAAGHFSKDEKPVCVPCSTTQYQSKPGSTTCEVCPGSSRAAVEGSVALEDCEDAVLGFIKHNILIAVSVTLAILVAATGTYYFVKRRLGKKDVKAKMFGLEKAKSEEMARLLPKNQANERYSRAAAVTEDFPINAAIRPSLLYISDANTGALIPIQTSAPLATSSNTAINGVSPTTNGGVPQGQHPSGQVSIVLNNQVPQALGNTPAATEVPPPAQQPRNPNQPPPLRPVPSYHSSTHFVAQPRPVPSFSRMPERPAPAQRYSLVRAGGVPRLPPPPTQGQARPFRGPAPPQRLSATYVGPRPF